MERKPEESFEDYRARRAVANHLTKRINADSKGGKQPNDRVNRPNKGSVKYSYAEAIRMHFARKNVKAGA